MARVLTNVGLDMRSSNGNCRINSSSLAPQRRCQSRNQRRYAPIATPIVAPPPIATAVFRFIGAPFPRLDPNTLQETQSPPFVTSSRPTPALVGTASLEPGPKLRRVRKSPLS